MRRSERFEIGERARLDVRLPSGLVDVRTGAAGTIEVVVEASDPESFDIARVGDTVSVRPPSRWGLRGRTTVAVVVPDGTEVELSTTSADVRMGGSLGPVRVRTTSGDVEIDAVARLELGTTSGDARVGTVHGDASITTVSGEARVGTVAGRVQGSAVSGDLRIAHVGGDVRFGTTSGDVRIERCDGSDIALKSISGDLVLGLPTGISVEADLSTTSGRATLPVPAPPSAGEEPRRPVRLALRSVSGDLTIQRAAPR